MQEVHGHKVMEMMLADGGSFSRDSLIAAVEDRFGGDSRFFTCSKRGMTAAELVDFLDARGKFSPSGAGFNTSRERICDY